MSVEIKESIRDEAGANLVNDIFFRFPSKKKSFVFPRYAVINKNAGV
jgi:hypothetical protein